MSKSYANRGMKLENLIDKTNEKYKKLGIADVRKVPTPIKIISYNKGRISGFPMSGNFVDYVGMTYDKFLVFDAKETSSDTSYSLSNIHEHQYELLESWYNYGAISFLIINFTGKGLYFYLPFESIKWAWDRMLNGGRKSISLNEFYEHATEVYKVNGILDYLNKA